MGVPSRMGQTFQHPPVRLLLSRAPTDRLLICLPSVPYADIRCPLSPLLAWQPGGPPTRMVVEAMDALDVWRRHIPGISKVGDTSGRLITTALRTALSKEPIDSRNHGQKMPCSTLA
jgi:hypothetical protein